MSEGERYAPAAQMLICFIFPTHVQKNADSDDRCHAGHSTAKAAGKVGDETKKASKETAEEWVPGK
jgi:hypothetical protein